MVYHCRWLLLKKKYEQAQAIIARSTSTSLKTLKLWNLNIKLLTMAREDKVKDTQKEIELEEGIEFEEGIELEEGSSEVYRFLSLFINKFSATNPISQITLE